MEQWLEDWGSPDSAIKTLLAWFFGQSSAIVIIFLIINGALGFRETSKTVLSGYRKAQSGFYVIKNAQPRSVAAIVILHLSVACLQLLWIYATYTLGLFISFLVSPDAARVRASDIFSWSTLQAMLHANTGLSDGLLIAGGVAIVLSYTLQQRETDGPGLLVALFTVPLFLVGFFWPIAAAFIAIAWVFGWNKNDPDLDPKYILLLLGASAVVYVYYKACCVAFNGPKLLYQMRQRLGQR